MQSSPWNLQGVLRALKFFPPPKPPHNFLGPYSRISHSRTRKKGCTPQTCARKSKYLPEVFNMELSFIAAHIGGGVSILIFALISLGTLRVWHLAVTAERVPEPGEKCQPCYSVGMKNIQATQYRHGDIACCEICAKYEDHLALNGDWRKTLPGSSR